MRAGERMRAWRPRVPGVHEVLHAAFTQHAYPPHTHDEWALLLIDAGEVAYALDGAPRRAPAGTVSLLPPHVAHDGRAAGGRGFRKRVVYLDAGWLPGHLAGASVDRPVLPGLSPAVRALHDVLAAPGDELEAETRLLRVREGIRARLGGAGPRAAAPVSLAAGLRDLLDARVVPGIELAEAAHILGAHPATLARVFRDAYGISPHRYLVGRRIDLARHLLSDGWPPADAATASGFYDQAHLTRHFVHTLGVTPARYARGG